MPRVKLRGVLYERRRDGRGYRKGYFAIIADGRLVKSLGDKVKNGYTVDAEVKFKRRLLVIAKAGPSGLEGSKPDGGVWYTLILMPSDRERRLTLRLPYHEDATIYLELSGEFDVYKMESCDWCRESDFIKLGEPLENYVARHQVGEAGD